MTDKDRALLIADQFELVRSDASRTIRSDLSMLRSAFIALQNGRHRVVEDHLERVIDSLNRALSRLDNAAIDC